MLKNIANLWLTVKPISYTSLMQVLQEKEKGATTTGPRSRLKCHLVGGIHLADDSVFGYNQRPSVDASPSPRVRITVADHVRGFKLAGTSSQETGPDDDSEAQGGDDKAEV